MIYLDYSATTKVDSDIIKLLKKTCKENYANPNSSHKLGQATDRLINDSIYKISKLLGIKESEIIFTSGASESNNLAIKGVALRNKSKGKHIISTRLEHSSVTSALSYLSSQGFEIEFVNLLSDGTVDLEHLKSIVREDTILVTITAVDSEIGIRQPIEEIGKILKTYNNCVFHSDITQCIGKSVIDLTYVDLASMSGHKIFCFKGIGLLYKKEDIEIEPIIHGGRSTTIYRSGTPQTELIVCLARSLEKALDKIDDKYNYVLGLNKSIKDEIAKYKNVYINSTDKSIPQILNISIIGIESDKFQKMLENKNIYVSTKSACTKGKEPSTSVFTITKSNERANSSIRISLSYKTKRCEVVKFLKEFKDCYNNIDWK